MVDIFRIGTSALSAMQQAIATTGHNIANVNTPGYNRQSVVLVSAPAQLTSAGYLGTGVLMSGVDRSYSEFLTAQMRGLGSSVSRYDTFHSLTSRIDSLLADSQNNLSMSMQQFFDKLQDMVNNPSALAERQALLGGAGNLVSQQVELGKTLGGLEQDTNAGIESLVLKVNRLTEDIAKLNHAIVGAGTSNSSQLPNDMLDQRDQLVQELAKCVGIKVNQADDGSVSVFIGQGRALIVGESRTELIIVRNPFDSTRVEIGVNGVTGATNITSQLAGGELQGYLDFRQRVLDLASNQLGLITLGLTQSFNAQHRLGVDLNGNQGGDFFAAGALVAHSNNSNAGTATPVVSVQDVGSLRPSDYRLSYDGSVWELTREVDGTSVTGTGPLVLDGLSVAVSSGTPTSGDSFTIRPRDANSGFALLLHNAEAIAAAGAVTSKLPIANLGDLSVSGLAATDATQLPLTGAIILTFNPAAMGAGLPGFDVTVNGVGAAAIAYDPATDSQGRTLSLGIAGITFNLSGSAQTGDQLLIRPNASGFGDNRNAVALADLQHQPLLDGGSSTYQEVYGGLVAHVGVQTQHAKSNLTMETTLFDEAQSSRDSLSGVNLDEEAANLLRLQQVYQAAAKLIAATDTMLQTLLNLSRN